MVCSKEITKGGEKMQAVTVIQPKLTDEKSSIKRVAAYCRVSTDSADQLHSFAAQMRHYMQKFSASPTEILVDVYADEGVSGVSAEKRTEFQRMLKDCRNGKINRIVTKSISRFARNTKECLETVRELRSLGITIYFEKEGIDTANIADEFMITLMGGLAQEESVSMSQNMKWSYQKRFQSGSIKAFSAPFGYELKDGKLCVQREQAEIVKTVYALFLNGWGYEKIAAYCQNTYSQNKEAFSFFGIRYMLSNEKYIGDSIYQKTYTTGIPYKKVQNKGEKDQYYLSNTHEAIIEPELFQTVQNLIAKRQFHNEKHTYPLSKKIYCGVCKSIYRRKFTRGKVYWVCYQHDKNAELCGSRRIPEQKIYDAFLRLFHKLKQNYNNIFLPMFAQLQALKDRQYAGNEQYLQISREIAQYREQIHVLTRLRSKGFLDEKRFLEQTTSLQHKINRHQKKLRDITKSEDDDRQFEMLKEVAVIIEKAPNLLVNFDAELFETLIEKIIVTNQTTLKFYLYGGLQFTEELK